MLPPKFHFGGKGIRTPDFQLAKLALYQLSYAPERMEDCRLQIADCNVGRIGRSAGDTQIIPLAPN
jgi:hypothetical protein